MDDYESSLGGYGMDNKNYNSEQINQYYSHPVWLLSSLFIEIIKISVIHKS